MRLSQCVCHFLALLPRALQWFFTVPCASCLGVFLPPVENLVPFCLHCGSSSTGVVSHLAGIVRYFSVPFLKHWWSGLKVLRC